MNGLSLLKPMATSKLPGLTRRHFTSIHANERLHSETTRRLLRVLIVDNEPDAANELAWQVHAWGHVVRSACDGYTALRIAAIQHPNVVILNLDSARIDWQEVVEQLRRDFMRKSCFIIGLTSLKNDSLGQHNMTEEIDLVLRHPLDLSVLETLLVLEVMRLQRFQKCNKTV